MHPRKYRPSAVQQLGHLLGLAAFVAQISSSGVALAASGAPKGRDEARARAHWERGAELYEAGDPRGAIAEWEDGYVLSERPEFLLNIAQAYRGLGDSAKAVYYYRLYLKRKPDAPDAKDVREIVADLERDGGTGTGTKGSGRGTGDDDPPDPGGTGDDLPGAKRKGPVVYDDDGRPIEDGRGSDGGDPDGDSFDDGSDRTGSGRGPRSGDDPLRRELGSSYDAYERSGLTLEGFRKVRIGSTLMVVGGIALGGGAALVILSFVDDPGMRTPLESIGITGGVVVFLAGAYLLYFGYAAWASGGKMTRSASYSGALAPAPGLGFAVAPLRGGGLLTLRGSF